MSKLSDERVTGRAAGKKPSKKVKKALDKRKVLC